MMNVPVFSDIHAPQIPALLRAGKIGVMPSDTQYGMFCAASDAAAVARIYQIQKRDLVKQCVVLVASFEEALEVEGLDRNTLLMAEKYWPGPVSVIVPCKKTTLPHINLGHGDIALRIPDYPELQALLAQSGPLMAPSANPQGLPPAETIQEAQAYFGDQADFYVDGGSIGERLASTIIRFTEDGLVETLRQGALTIDENGTVL